MRAATKFDRSRSAGSQNGGSLDGLVAGLPNETIAYDLGVRAHMIEVHRARLMIKMQVDSLSALVRLALAARVEGNG